MPPQFFGLPLISPELKSITPYLQRADELKTQDPIVAYWCAYYAAQVGIALKARDNASREILFSLLGILERMKEDIGPNDAIDMEAASAAYVENFALKVFTMADNEDRNGRATRSTAKKFLAAANFLEVLKIFPKTEIQESNEEKIRYAKWKAADIAKAFREGRKPTPGPAGSEAEPETFSPAPPVLGNNNNSSTATLVAGSPQKGEHKVAGSPPRIDIISGSPPRQDPSFAGQRASPPHPQIDPADIARANVHAPSRRKDLSVEVDGQIAEGPPDSWSTAATPGTGHGNTPLGDMPNPHEQYHLSDQIPIAEGSTHIPRSGLPSSANVDTAKGQPRRASINEEREGRTAPPAAVSPPKKVTFTPSVVGGSASQGSIGTDHASYGSYSPSTIQATESSQYSPISPSMLPPTQSSIYAPPSPPRSNIYALPSTSPPRTNIYAPSSPPRTNIYATPVPPPVAAVPPPATVELTPSVVAKVQKHCRFAISALDYEDAETARRELRVALNMLGG